MSDTVRPKRRFPSKRSAAAALLLLGLLGGGVAAYAYFTASGSGSGTGSVGSATPWSVINVSSSGTMYPGGGSVTLSYTVKNVGSGHQAFQIAAVSVATGTSGGNTVVLDSSSGNPVAGCLATWFGVDNTGAAAAADLAPSATETGSAAVTMTNAGASQDLCQGVSPKLTVSVS